MMLIFSAAVMLSMAAPESALLLLSSPVLKTARFEQVALTVRDLDRARTFYRDRMGLRLMFEANRMLFFDVSGVRLMVAEDRVRTRSPRPTAILYLHSDDFTDARSRLQKTGARLVGEVERVDTTSAGDLVLQQFEDPDGNMLALMGVMEGKQ